MPDHLPQLAALAERKGFKRWPWPKWWRRFTDKTQDIVPLPAGTTVQVVDEALVPGKGRVATAAITAEDFAQGGACSLEILGDDPPAPLIAAFMAAKKQLHQDDTGVRFPRTRLVAAMTSWEIGDGTEGEAGDSVPGKLRSFYASRVKRSDTSDDLLAEFIKALPIPFAAPLSLVFVLVRRSSSQFWYWGAPGSRPDCRWLRHQWKSQPNHGTFKTFVLGLTLGARRGPKPGKPSADVAQLAALAFLADLHAAYQPRLWLPWTWRRRRPALILDRVGTELPALLEGARDKRDQDQDDACDPLLIVLLPDAAKPPVPDPAVVVGQSRDRYLGPRLPGLALLVSAVATVVPVLLVLVLLSRFGVPVPGLWLLHLPGSATPSSTPSSSAKPCTVDDADTHVTLLHLPIPNSSQTACVGYSSTNAFTFRNPPLPKEDKYKYQTAQDQRVSFDEDQIFAENKNADDIEARETGRVEVKLVYFAGITEGSAEDYDSAEGEELEGLLAAQMEANDNQGLTTAPVLKIVVANGGPKMELAPQVANMLLPLFKPDDPHMLGVVGLDRSTSYVRSAIQTFAQNRIPVLATTLSADNFIPASLGKYYFSLVPPNSDEAKLIMNYINNTVTQYFKQPASAYYSAGQVAPTQVNVYEPPDPDPQHPDYYLSTLVSDLENDRKMLPSKTNFQKVVPKNSDKPLPADLCGAATVDIYAGRHDRPSNAQPGQLDDFGGFLNVINGCPQNQKPFVIGDDAVARFIADPAARADGQSGNWPISYVTKALSILDTGTDCLYTHPDDGGQHSFQKFCEDYAQIATTLRKKVKNVQLPWTGERVGLAYDTAELFLTPGTNALNVLTRDRVPDAFENGPYQGVTGTVSFSPGKHVGVDFPSRMQLAIVRISMDNSDDPPVCAVTSASAATDGTPSSTEPNPAPTPAGCVHGLF